MKKFLVALLVLLACGGSEVFEDTVTSTSTFVLFEAINFPCSSSLYKVVLEENHVIVFFESNPANAYIYKRNIGFTELSNEYKRVADCKNNLSGGDFHNFLLNQGHLLKEPNWKEVSLSLKGDD